MGGMGWQTEVVSAPMEYEWGNRGRWGTKGE